MVRTPDPENDIRYLKRRKTTLQNELSRVKRKLSKLEADIKGESLVKETVEVVEPEEGESEQPTKTSGSKTKKKRK